MDSRFDFVSITGFQTLELFYRDFERRLQHSDRGHAVFDLSRVPFVTPELLMPLACATRLWSETSGQPVEWYVGDNEVLRYLERAGAFKACANYLVPFKLPENLWKHGAGVNLVPLAEIDHNAEQNSIDVQQILARATDLLLGRVDPKRMGAACTILSEVASNITHSLTKGYALMQVYKSGTGYRVHIAVADTGIGIPTSLQEKYPSVGRASDYLQLALKEGVTSSDQIRGTGLSTVQRLVHNGGGVLAIRSQTAMLAVLQEGNLYCRDDLAYIPGTQVFITLWGRYAKGHWNFLLP